MSERVPDGSDRGLRVRVTARGCWCEGARGVIRGPSSTPGFFTVDLGAVGLFLAKVGEVEACR